MCTCHSEQINETKRKCICIQNQIVPSISKNGTKLKLLSAAAEPVEIKLCVLQFKHLLPKFYETVLPFGGYRGSETSKIMGENWCILIPFLRCRHVCDSQLVLDGLSPAVFVWSVFEYKQKKTGLTALNPGKSGWAVTTKRNSAIADKPRDAFRGQSRSPNMVPFHMLGMVSY